MIKKIAIRIIIGLVLVVLILFLSIMTFMNISPQFGAAPSGTHLEKISKSSNYGSKQFENLIPTTMDMNFRKGMGVMYEWIFNTSGREPDKALPSLFNKTSNQNPDSLSKNYLVRALGSFIGD